MGLERERDWWRNKQKTKGTRHCKCKFGSFNVKMGESKATLTQSAHIVSKERIRELMTLSYAENDMS